MLCLFICYMVIPSVSCKRCVHTHSSHPVEIICECTIAYIYNVCVCVCVSALVCLCVCAGMQLQASVDAFMQTYICVCVCVLHCTNPQSVQEGNATTTCLILTLLLFSQRMWGQHGGHMSVIETTPCGVIWAISFDQTLWVYNGGYGSALTRGKLGTCVHAICRKGHREVEGGGLGWGGGGGEREGSVNCLKISCL